MFFRFELRWLSVLNIRVFEIVMFLESFDWKRSPDESNTRKENARIVSRHPNHILFRRYAYVKKRRTSSINYFAGANTRLNINRDKDLGDEGFDVGIARMQNQFVKKKRKNDRTDRIFGACEMRIILHVDSKRTHWENVVFAALASRNEKEKNERGEGIFTPREWQFERNSKRENGQPRWQRSGRSIRVSLRISLNRSTGRNCGRCVVCTTVKPLFLSSVSFSSKNKERGRSRLVPTRWRIVAELGF